MKALRLIRQYSNKPDLFLNPHAWEGLPADQIFQLHQIRKNYMGKAYNPTNEERTAILSTITSLARSKPNLDYSFEIENFKERIMNNTPMKDRGNPQKLSNQYVINSGNIPHNERRFEQLNRIAAYEMPLLVKYREKYIPPDPKDSPIKLIYNSDFSNETSNKFNRKVTLQVKLQDLNLNKEQEHKFKILSGKRFHHDLQTFQLKSEKYQTASQNVTWLINTFNKLLKESKDLSKELFEDIPLDKRHMKTWTKKPIPNFPENWKKPEDAPVKRHDIISDLVEISKNKLDNDQLQKISP
ncbi:RSM24 [Candida pseudojiufengensis]|uniref:RSM24 n=1 Tax=Candida pseudojiufengensis TaxID=497109 RepID=UPI002224B884|nr:RSM24 [Candida pseudojiufengensis]KAI5966274.1 RSM24 [Candida pseudojiufengensis]